MVYVIVIMFLFLVGIVIFELIKLNNEKNKLQQGKEMSLKQYYESLPKRQQQEQQGFSFMNLLPIVFALI